MKTPKLHLLGAIALIATSTSHAAVTVTNQWRLGEDGATTASIGAVNLTAVGSTSNGAGVATGSTTSQSFTNEFGTGPQPAASNYYTATIGIGSTNNWGMSIWINPSQLPNGTQGEIGFLQLGSINLEMYAGGWLVHHPGSDLTTVTTLSAPSLNTSFQVSYVNEGGTANFYVNGSSASVIARNSGNNLLIGAMQNNIRGFNGLIDEVSVFTFDPGSFSPTDLNALPEPSSAIFGCLSVLALFARRRR